MTHRNDPHEFDFLAAAHARLGRMERAQIRFIRHTFSSPAWDRSVRWCQRHIGAGWIHACTKHLRSVHGIDRLPAFDPDRSYVCVANHRSFFDLYVVTAELVRRGLPHRLVFPVRSHFYYDSALGLLVNGSMSFFAMYPPIFRDRKKAAVNVASLRELARLLGRGGVFTGLHPEGTRKKDDDPYTFLPAQPGVGRVIYEARVPVIPVFVNGLGNRAVRQIRGNFDRRGAPILVVFGEPIDYREFLARPASPRTYQAISERALQAIAALGQEEKKLRQSLVGGGV